MGRRAKPAKVKAKATPPLARKAPTKGAARVHELEQRLAESLEREKAKDRALTEALDQQTATGDILRVISSCPADVQPVFDAIVESATKLCDATWGAVFRFDGGLQTFVAGYNVTARELAVLQREFPRPLTRDRATGRAIADRRIVHIADIQRDPEYAGAPLRAVGFRSVLAVPMLRDGESIGVLGLWRQQVRPFTEKQIELVEIFADQAVIAIENVRLFTELQQKNESLTTAHAQVTEALEQQTATSEILRVISSSPTDIQPVLEAVVRNASRLCGASNVSLYQVEGRLMRKVAEQGPSLTTLRVGETRPITRTTVSGRAIVDRTTLHLPDYQAVDAAREYPDVRRDTGIRTTIGIPLLREAIAIGSFTAYRTEPRPFSEREIALLKTFADQAVIAIENVRLFKELEERNRALTEALEQQTATGEILRVISSSPTDLQPVLDAVVRSAARFCGAPDASIFRLDGQDLRADAHHGPVFQPMGFRVPVVRGTVAGRSVLERQAVSVTDLQIETEGYPEGSSLARQTGQRATLSAPLLREGAPIGVILLRRAEAVPFTGKQIELLKTFADQAVIAIENARLFTELEGKNRALTQAHAQVTESLEQQTATGEILRVISQSPTDVGPVFAAVATSAARLCDAFDAAIHRIDGDVLRLVAHEGPIQPDAVLPLAQGTFAGHVVRERRAMHVADLQAEADVYPVSSEFARNRGFRTILGVPLLRGTEVLGTITIRRSEVRLFTDRQAELLKTFADQAVIAIENVRLFQELEARTHELTRSVGELRALGEVGQAISSTLDLRTVLSTIVARATQLSGTDAGVIYEYDEQREVFVPRATEHLEAEIVETMLATPVRKGEGATGRLAEIQEPVQVPDILEAPAESRVRSVLVRAGYRALLAVPLVREEQLIGGLTVIRKATGAFAPEAIELLQTFATQSSLAIQNARLFREIEDKSRQLEVASQHKSEFLANMSHELRTPLNAIIGFSEVLTERMFGDLNEKQEEYLKDIYASGTHLLSLINDILDLSKIEAGRMELELSDFHLPTALENALMLVRERAGRRSIALHTSIDNRLGEIRADERKIRQVVLNLLSNAIKFTPEGGRIEVTAVPQNGSVEVSVSDTGVGIAPEDQEPVFEEFRQVGTAEKKAEGTGLGLTLCRKFVELHGGRIWVKSQIGQGSTFTFTLPVSR